MSQLKELLFSHPEWIAPRSDQHTVIGVPDSREHRKTFVEPGGSFSPGIGSFGVSVWVWDHREEHLYAPEELPIEELQWEWEGGYLPVLNSRWQGPSFEISQQLFAAPLANPENIVNSLKVTLTNRTGRSRLFSLYLVIRPYGAAGGKVRKLAVDERTGGIAVNGKTILLARLAWNEFGATSFTESGQEISTFLKKGQLPASKSVEDKAGLGSGGLAYNLSLAAQQKVALEFDFFVHPLEQHYLEKFREYHNHAYTTKLAQITAYWETRLKTVQLNLPDKRYSNAFYSILAQHLIAMVAGEVRIGTVTYPLLWLRDGVYIINALDKAGLHREMQAQLGRLEGQLFAGGFGAEPDAFGEVIWAFKTHFQLTGDREWLRSVYPDLKQRADWIIRARHTAEYLYADTPTRVPDRRFAADSDLICEPARDGLIQGRMDWHRPLIWINAFSWLGLNAVAGMAHLLGYAGEAQLYEKEADELQTALCEYGRRHFGENERDFVCALWPAEAFTADEVRKPFDRWWQTARLNENGEYHPEPLWKYFELGQAHNYLFLGEVTRTQQTVNYYLDNHDVQNLFGWLEDSYDIGEHWSQIEGWYKLPSRQPHGWVASEFFLLLRDLWLYENNETLVLGSGIPADWLQQSAPFQMLNLPSNFGPVDFSGVSVGHNRLEIEIVFRSTERMPQQVVLNLPLPWADATLFCAKGTVAHNKVILSRTEYEARGKVTLLLEYKAGIG